MRFALKVWYPNSGVVLIIHKVLRYCEGSDNRVTDSNADNAVTLTKFSWNDTKYRLSIEDKAMRGMFTLNDVLHLLEDDTYFQEADVFMTGAEDATKSDEDSGHKDLGGNINKLTRNQLRADMTVSVRSATGSVSNITDTNHSNTSQDAGSDVDFVSDASDTTIYYDVQIPRSPVQIPAGALEISEMLQVFPTQLEMYWYETQQKPKDPIGNKCLHFHGLSLTASAIFHALLAVFGVEPSINVPVINVTLSEGDLDVLPFSVDFLEEHKYDLTTDPLRSSTGKYELERSATKEWE
ncbi:hypothetical protein DPMN_110527 [Dreissena polymorpha]|uniref:Uncharacterized protein n=1 Tax=Dreissena polymorpha TaxID=45954 RepID=A0A9D4QN47_DREPO|nr:hypothetical protein DPMN_110527 [Dreissena polymorpha]